MAQDGEPGDPGRGGCDDAEDLRRILDRLPELIGMADAMGMATARDLLIAAERAALHQLSRGRPSRLH